ncbi:MAG: Crp/Fnr family transcriptional regulator [Deltaproteobacteria bacterium]|jgi:CRP/FNR family transcriptional regulator, dissimilatory nitrate respiration regulator|nr:Crp/Fnr family transcriptional regulator [Deltaproteobacteria bacterium]
MAKSADVLKQTMLFSGLEVSELNDLGKVASSTKVKSGGVIFNEGDEAQSFYVLVEGSIDLVKSSAEGKEQLIRNVKRGEVFAEAAMFAGSTYPVTAITKSDSKLMVFGKKALLSFIKRHPDVSLKMMGVMSNLLRHLNSLLGELSLGTVSSRLAAYLLKRAKDEGGKEFLLGMAKRDLAFHIGTIPATLSRNLAKMSSDVWIEVKGNRILLKDIKALRAASGR